MFRLCLVISFLASVSLGMGQNNPGPGLFWKDISPGVNLSRTEAQIKPEKFRALSLNLEAFRELMETCPQEAVGHFSVGTKPLLYLPHPVEGFVKFEVVETQLMAPGLAKRYPEIKTWIGRAIDHSHSYARLDIGPEGFHAMVFFPEGMMFIDPAIAGDTEQYISYFKQDLRPNELFYEGEMDRSMEAPDLPMPSPLRRIPNGRQLKTYRIAIAATGEYTAYHGASLAGAMSGITTTLNRVVGIYERELAVRFELVANNDQVVYLDGATDPYSNYNASAMLNQNITNLNNVIGESNYDIGHVFSTGGGGLAGLGNICRSSGFNHKAEGVTGISTPAGDPYDVDYVAHEIGHQMGADHTFNGSRGNCSGNRASQSAYEPGSGTTIMGYAGLCGSHNLQNNSHDYFHTESFEQMVEVINGSGSLCANIINTNNSPPMIQIDRGGTVIPISTPFELRGSATDPDGDSLSYCWEQYDLGPAGHPNSPSGNAPLIRSFPPAMDSIRTVPRLSDLVNGTTTTGEVLPGYTRSMKFRLTVRDNHVGAGGVDFASLTLFVSDSAGPFLVSQPNGGEQWEAQSQVAILWDVAGTDASPVNCPEVDIFLSLDGGYTYPLSLAQTVPNVGSAVVTLPDTFSSQARIKVIASNNVFFDISNNDFEIRANNTSVDTWIKEVQVRAFPNPSSGDLFLDLKADRSQNLEVVMMNSLGQEVAHRWIYIRAGEERREQISVAHLPNGVYVYRIVGENGQKADKIIIQH